MAITTLKLLKFSITATPYVLMSLPCMTSSSFTLRFLLDDLGISTGSFIVQLFGFGYLFQIFIVFYFISLFIPTFWFKFLNLIFILIHFTKKKLLYTDLQLLRKCKCCNCHHDHQLTATHSIVCYYIVYLLIHPLQRRFPLPWIICLIFFFVFAVIAVGNHLLVMD